MSELSHEEVTLILSIVDGSESAVISLEVDGLKVRVLRGRDEENFLNFANSPDVAAAHEASSAEIADAVAIPADAAEEYEILRAPLLGDFISSQDDAARPFVLPGDAVEAGALLGLIEIAGKRHEIRAKEAGRIVEVLAEDMKMVEFEQPLFVIDAARAT